jgi:hypothetical protein
MELSTIPAILTFYLFIAITAAASQHWSAYSVGDVLVKLLP